MIRRQGHTHKECVAKGITQCMEEGCSKKHNKKAHGHMMEAKRAKEQRLGMRAGNQPPAQPAVPPPKKTKNKNVKEESLRRIILNQPRIRTRKRNQRTMRRSRACLKKQ